MDSAIVDQSAYTATALAIEPKLVNRQTGEIAKTADGLAKWACAAFLVERESGRGDLVKVTIPSARTPEIQMGAPIQFQNLRVRFWAQNGRSGLAWVADGIESPPAGKG